MHIAKITICIVEPTTVIKAMRDFMANDTTNGTKVEVTWHLVIYEMMNQKGKIGGLQVAII